MATEDNPLSVERGPDNYPPQEGQRCVAQNTQVESREGGPLVMDEIVEEAPTGYGKYLGRVKWFQNKKGHGFIIVLQPKEAYGTEVFVHFSGLKPLKSLFKTLQKNEYVSFNMGQGKQGVQAVDVTGVMGGPLICDGYPPKPSAHSSMAPKVGPYR